MTDEAAVELMERFVGAFEGIANGVLRIATMAEDSEKRRNLEHKDYLEELRAEEAEAEA